MLGEADKHRAERDRWRYDCDSFHALNCTGAQTGGNASPHIPSHPVDAKLFTIYRVLNSAPPWSWRWCVQGLPARP
jgi:hypothetical protein